MTGWSANLILRQLDHSSPPASGKLGPARNPQRSRVLAVDQQQAVGVVEGMWAAAPPDGPGPSRVSNRRRGAPNRPTQRAAQQRRQANSTSQETTGGAGAGRRSAFAAPNSAAAEGYGHDVLRRALRCRQTSTVSGVR